MLQRVLSAKPHPSGQPYYAMVLRNHLLAAVIQSTHPIKDVKIYNGYMNTLRTHFERLHPIHIRLLKMASYCPKSTDPQTYFGEFIKLMQEADISTLSAEDVCLALMTSRCHARTCEQNSFKTLQRIRRHIPNPNSTCQQRRRMTKRSALQHTGRSRCQQNPDHLLIRKRQTNVSDAGLNTRKTCAGP